MIQTKTIVEPAIIILIAALVGIIASASIVSIASASIVLIGGHVHPPLIWHTASGTIASIQNDKNGKPAWILSGDWNIRAFESGYVHIQGNSTFHMMMLNRSESHMHTIKDFNVSRSDTAWPATWNGTATIIMKGIPISNVPISISLFYGRDWPTAMKLWIDPTKVMNHFGNTPIYGMWNHVGDIY